MSVVEHSSPSSQRVALLLQYLGTHFHGWQRQPQHRSVQGELEAALTSVVGEAITVHGAGRTDSGVHAAAQVAHFDVTGTGIAPERWAQVLNARLPKDLLIRASTAVPVGWHARFSALWRRYRYTIYTDQWPNLFVRQFSWHYYRAPLEENLIQRALTPLLGRHHLAAFHRAGSSRPHSWVEVQGVECYRRGPILTLEIQASGFLYGMVRLLVGLLVEVGSRQRSLEQFQEIWMQQRRELVKYAAPPQGLCLLRVGYPDPLFPPNLWFDSQPLLSFSSP
ncbi:tRNA pseudouridine synthase 1 [Synechocystis sp. LKSZ1]